jgi:hypothetical protein
MEKKMGLSFSYRKTMFVSWTDQNGKLRRKKIHKLNEPYVISYGLGFYDGPRSGIVISSVSGARYFFFCEEHQNGNRGYVIFDLKKEQWERVDKHISLLESMAGTHCRYINGTRIESTNPEYKYFSTQESWNKFCSIIQTENLDIHRPELELSQIIGFVTRL